MILEEFSNLLLEGQSTRTVSVLTFSPKYAVREHQLL